MKKNILLFLFSILIISCSKESIEEEIKINSPILGKWEQTGFGGPSNWNPILSKASIQFYEDGTFDRILSTGIFKGYYNVIKDANSNNILLIYSSAKRIDFYKEFIYLENNSSLILQPDHNCYIPCSRIYKRIQ